MLFQIIYEVVGWKNVILIVLRRVGSMVIILMVTQLAELALIQFGRLIASSRLVVG